MSEAESRGLKIVDTWKNFWLRESDYKHRVIDANMRHHLSDMLNDEFAKDAEEIAQLKARVEGLTGVISDMLFLMDKGTAKIWPEKVVAACLKIAREALKYFVDRVEAGTIQSKTTYKMYKELLK